MSILDCVSSSGDLVVRFFQSDDSAGCVVDEAPSELEVGLSLPIDRYSDTSGSACS